MARKSKKPSVSSARGNRAAKSAKHIPDHKIDFSDISDSTDEELKRARRVGRPATGNAKQLIAIRIDPKLLSALRKLASTQDKPYQTLIHELLEKAAKKVA
jgi:predicted DNA binding CopG/RHH family protein